MKFFFWWRGDPDGLERAKRAEAEAERRLEEAHRRAPAVRAEANWARAARERNHLTELFRGGNS